MWARRVGWLWLAAVAVLAAAAYLVWQRLEGGGLPPGIGAGNGRIEAVSIDIATRTAGRLSEILVDEGDFVAAGQVMAEMDTDQLEAQKREAAALLRRAGIGVETAQSVVRQRQAERQAAQAVVSQREVERDAAARRLARTEPLTRKGNASEQALDDARAAVQGAAAALGAAKAQLAASDAAIGAAQSQVVDAQAAIEAAAATLQRIQVDLDDSRLVAPRDGRVQFRIAQPGEVLPAGGRVLNMVDLSDVYMTFFLPTEQAGQVALGSPARIMLDAAPGIVVPATISFVSDVAQFTPKTVETELERQKLMFRVRAKIPPDLLRQHIEQVKTGLPGMAYVRLDPAASWPEAAQGRLLQ